MNIRDLNARWLGDIIDDRPGFYYASVHDAGKVGLLAGPFPTHPEALAMVDAARSKANEVNDRACFYAYGTLRCERDAGPGVLNDLLGITRGT